MSALDFTARALALRAEREIRDGGSVLLNGAAGDGASDDRAALNAFIARGGHVEFPPAAYKLSETLFVPSETHIRMAPGARLLPADANASMIRVAGSPPATWVALTSDIPAGAKAFAHASGAYTIGQWIELRSNALVTSGPNSTLSKLTCLRKIVGKSGSGPYTYTLNKPVPEAYNTADTAEIGVPTMVENVVLENVTLNDENFSTLIGNGISLSYCANVRIVRPTIFGSKAKLGADVVSPAGIAIGSCFGVTIEDPLIKHIGWYGIGISRSDGVRVRGGHIEDTRHAVSCVWHVYGEPADILIQGVTAMNQTLSGFDTHDTGRDIVFDGCVSFDAGDDGFQLRTNNVHAVNCSAYGSTNDGFSDGATTNVGIVLVGCRAEGNHRLGVNFSGRAELTNCDVLNHTGPASGFGGVQLTSGGRIVGGRFAGNGSSVLRVTGGPLLVQGVYAPADAVQTLFAIALTTNGGKFNRTIFRDCEIPGYALNSIFARNQAARPAGDLPPITSGNRLTTDSAGAEQSGEVTLVAGTATVNTTAVKRQTATPWTEDVISRVDLRRISPGGTVGDLYVESVTSATGFVIRSTNAADTSKVRWTVEL
jgi:hypothetical protein